MDQRKDAQSRLWIRNRDSLGNMIDDKLIEAAHRVWERARLVVIRYLAEDTEAPEILDDAVDAASRARQRPVHRSLSFNVGCPGVGSPTSAKPAHRLHGHCRS